MELLFDITLVLLFITACIAFVIFIPLSIIVIRDLVEELKRK